MWREKLLLLKKEQNDLHQTEDSGMEKKPYKSGTGFKAQGSRFMKSEQQTKDANRRSRDQNSGEGQ